MRLRLFIIVMALAAMGPARDEAAPDAESVSRVNPARLPPVAAREPAPPAEDPAPRSDRLEFLSANDAAPADFLWSRRPVVVFADTPDDPSFVQQIAAMERDGAALVGRDVVVVTDSDPASGSPWRRDLRPQGFSLVLIDKDGQVKIRRPSPWDVREIGRAIDRLPLRRQEVGPAR